MLLSETSRGRQIKPQEESLPVRVHDSSDKRCSLSKDCFMYLIYHIFNNIKILLLNFIKEMTFILFLPLFSNKMKLLKEKSDKNCHIRFLRIKKIMVILD